MTLVGADKRNSVPVRLDRIEERRAGLEEASRSNTQVLQEHTERLTGLEEASRSNTQVLQEHTQALQEHSRLLREILEAVRR